jgi:hypothetical protein
VSLTLTRALDYSPLADVFFTLDDSQPEPASELSDDEHTGVYCLPSTTVCPQLFALN